VRKTARCHQGAHADAVLVGLIRFLLGASVANYTDFSTQNNQARATLDARLAQWFGASSAFGCAEGRFATYYPYEGNSDMTAVHSGMQVTQVVFSAFFFQFFLSCQSMGMTQTDLNTINAYLQSFGRGTTRMAICNDQTCACASGYTGGNCDEVVSSTAPAVDPGSGPSTPQLGAAATYGGVAMTAILAAAAALFTMRL
jgi:hypothetical protein